MVRYRWFGEATQGYEIVMLGNKFL